MTHNDLQNEVETIVWAYLKRKGKLKTMCLEDGIPKKTLQDLDGEDWGEPNYPSYLVTEYHRLRRIPLASLNVENLRLLIGQSMSLDYLEYLLPLAFEHLQRDPWVSGDYYEGDLLKNVLGVRLSFWHSHPKLKQTFDKIAEKALIQATADLQNADLYNTRVLQQLREWLQIPKT